MKKYIKKHLKDEKRIIKLMYQKGMFEVLGLKITSLAWEWLKQGKRQRKRNKKFAWRDYLPEIHSYSCDYWEECYSYSVVNSLKEYFYWELATEFEKESGWPKNIFF